MKREIYLLCMEVLYFLSIPEQVKTFPVLFSRAKNCLILSCFFYTNFLLYSLPLFYFSFIRDSVFKFGQNREEGDG